MPIKQIQYKLFGDCLEQSSRRQSCVTKKFLPHKSAEKFLYLFG